jgi:hypothetical protein
MRAIKIAADLLHVWAAGAWRRTLGIRARGARCGARLRDLGLDFVMLAGDTQATARREGIHDDDHTRREGHPHSPDEVNHSS